MFLCSDDPVDKYIPEFKPPSADRDWPEYLRRREDNLDEEHSGRSSRITLRQLASHTSGKLDSMQFCFRLTREPSGLGRDYPTINFTKWPIEANDFPETGDGRNASKEAVLDGTAEYPLLNLPYAYPIYSNAGFDLLGLANVAANLKVKGEFAKGEPKTYKELVKRDIFNAFGLTSSFFRLPQDQDLKDHIAIPHSSPSWAVRVVALSSESAS
jgi:CubicO group peptidase (beta-lactamase class C family)